MLPRYINSFDALRVEQFYENKQMNDRMQDDLQNQILFLFILTLKTGANLKIQF